MKKITVLGVGLLVGLVSGVSSAATVVFDLRNGPAAEIEAGAYAVGGVNILMSSLQGALNQTTQGFGINYTGNSADETHLIDGDAGAEVLEFNFDEAGTLLALNMTSFGPSDTFDLFFKGVKIAGLTDQGASSPDVFVYNQAFQTGDIFELAYTGGNGASLDTVKIDAIPEPSTSLLFLMSGIACLGWRGRVNA